MKSVKFLIFTLVSVITIFPIFTKAESIINNKGVELTEEEYNNFLIVHTPEYIMNMDEAEYEHLSQFDYDDVTSTKKYIISTYNYHLGITSEREVTEEEYNNTSRDDNIATRSLNDNNAYIETTAKKFGMLLIGGSPYSYLTMSLGWKYIPSTRSFDVFGYYVDGLSIRNGSQTGLQQYYSNGTWHQIDYSWNGTNIKKFSNGFGISMNLVNDANLGNLALGLWCDVAQTDTVGSISGSYQHAVTNLTLANSQNYTLGGSGLGGVFVYPYNISAKYDGMSGLEIIF